MSTKTKKRVKFSNNLERVRLYRPSNNPPRNVIRNAPNLQRQNAMSKANVARMERIVRRLNYENRILRRKNAALRQKLRKRA